MGRFQFHKSHNSYSMECFQHVLVNKLIRLQESPQFLFLGSRITSREGEGVEEALR